MTSALDKIRAEIDELYNRVPPWGAEGLEMALEIIDKYRVESKDIRECASCKRSNNGECAYTEECHECMWKSKYEKRVESERKSGKWVHMVGFWECDQCHAEYTGMPTCMGKVIYEYCPMCGAKMEADNGTR